MIHAPLCLDTGARKWLKSLEMIRSILVGPLEGNSSVYCAISEQYVVQQYEISMEVIQYESIWIHHKALLSNVRVGLLSRLYVMALDFGA